MPSVFLNSVYWQSTAGLAKIVCLILLFMGFLCIEVSTVWNASANFFNLVAILEFICTLILFLLHLFNVPIVYIGVPWLSIEFFYCLGASLLIGLASLILAFNGSVLFIVAAIVGFLAMFFYGYDAVSKYREYTTSPAPVVA